MTERDLSADRAVCDAAYRGPWYAHAVHDCGEEEYSSPRCQMRIGIYEDDNDCDILAWSSSLGDIHPDDEANFQFIALARSALPYWLDEVERLRARVAELERKRPWAGGGGDFARWRMWLVQQPTAHLCRVMDAEAGKSEDAAEAEEELYDICCRLADGGDAVKEGTE